MIEEIGAQSDERILIALNELETLISTGLASQGKRLDSQCAAIRELRTKIDAQSARIDLNSEKIDLNSKKIDSLGVAIKENREAIRENRAAIDENRARIDKNREGIERNRSAIELNSTKIDLLSVAVRENREAINQNRAAIAENGAKIAVNGAKIDALSEKVAENTKAIERLAARLDALETKVEVLAEEAKSNRRERRLILALLAILIAMGLFGGLGQGCSVRTDGSQSGVEAAQPVDERAAEQLSVQETTSGSPSDVTESNGGPEPNRSPETPADQPTSDDAARR